MLGAMVFFNSTFVSAESSLPTDLKGGWPAYGGQAGGARFSTLTQITPANIKQLEEAWVYHTHDFPAERPDIEVSSFLATPILDEGSLFFCSGLGRAFAVDAKTGKERWVFDTESSFIGLWTKSCRGVALWKGISTKSAVCQRRVFMGVPDGGLVAIDADTGLACNDFGINGRVNLQEGIGDVNPGELYLSSPPIVINDVVIPGSSVMDNQRISSPGGVIRAYDVRTGEIRWTFDPVPPGAPTPQQIGAPASQLYHRGTPNAWSILSADSERNLVFIPFGGAGPDFIGGHRQRFEFPLDYYANSVVALNAITGEVVWHFQAVHHDLWDYDVASQPVLITVEKNGKIIPAVAQATKMGHIFLLHRETGEPIYPVEERPVPQTDVPGEYSSPTQPFPTFPKPLHSYGFDADDAWGFTFFSRDACKERIKDLRSEGIFTPPSLNGMLQYPGVAGGQNWGSLTWDPINKLLIMPQSQVVSLATLVPRDQHQAVRMGPYTSGYSPNIGTNYVVKHEILLSPIGTPCVPPPWGVIMAVSLETGEKVWEVPFGTTRDQTPLSFIPFGLNYGLPSSGGPINTKSGITFIGAALDNYLRAYNNKTGEELWRQRLPAGAQATPMTYEIDGKQYVVIAAGGHSAMRTKLGDSLMAFVLPDLKE